MARKLRGPNTRRRPISARLIVFIVSLAVFGATAPSRAQDAEDKAIGGPEQLLSPMGTEPSVATYGRGGFVIVWTNAEAGDFGIRGVLLAPGAVVPSLPFAVSTESEASHPAVSADSSGRFVVVWQSESAGGATIAGQLYGIGGARQGPEFAFPNSVNIGRLSPEVAMGDRGAFGLSWVELDFPSPLRNIRARFSGNGPLQLPAHGVAGNDNARIVHYPGGFAVGWDELAPCGAVCGTENHSVNAAVDRFDDSGRRVGRTYRLSADADTNPGFALAGLAASRAGALAVFSGPDGYFGQRFAPSGQPVGGLFPIRRGPVCGIDRCQTLKAVAMDDNGRFALVWEVSNGAAFNLYAQLYSAANKLRGGLVPVNLTLSIEPETPAAALANDGSLEVVWTRVELGQSVHEVFARRLRLP